MADLDIQRLRALLDKREELDREILALVSGVTATKKPITCSTCNEEGHTARTCPKKSNSVAIEVTTV